MISKLLLLPALASLACAENYVTSLIYPQPDSVANFEASVDGNAETTTYVLSCPSNKICLQSGYEGDPKEETLIYSGDRVTMIVPYSDTDIKMTLECSVDGTTSALCTLEDAGRKSTAPLSRLVITPVTVTAGTITGGSEPTSTSSSSSESASSGSSGSAQPEATESAGGDGEGEDVTPTGGVARVTGVAGTVVGGLAAALIGAAF
ncbi:uncharacterized protein BDV17DRAFT_263149 [Aspergillus undulatus]|uniref:uncharacterized protein n=1 Tax=Aspergillus undulatus TaxID=1810928 RepID=UPI003CCE0FCE